MSNNGESNGYYSESVDILGGVIVGSAAHKEYLVKEVKVHIERHKEFLVEDVKIHTECQKEQDQVTYLRTL